MQTQFAADRERAEYVQRVRRQRILHAAACENDLATFFRQSWKILEPVTELKDNWHIDLIAEYLEACRLRQIQQIIFNLPPRHGKSNLITVAFPCWVWLRDPGERFMFWSYAEELAAKHSRDRRSLIESPWYQRHWGNRYRLALDQNRQDRFANDKRGHMISNSLLGGGLGEGGNFSITDDPNDPIAANSDPIRDRTNKAYDLKVRGRIDDDKRGVKIITQQRTHEQDVTGHVLMTERDKWTWVKIPAIAPKSVNIRFPISGRKITRLEGTALHPQRNDIRNLADKKVAIGTFAFSGQWQQAPSPPGGTIFKREWWRHWKALPSWKEFDHFVISMDSAFKGEEDSCNTAIELWGKKGAEFYLIDCVSDQMDFVQARRALVMFCEQYKFVGRKIIEDTANGPAIIASLRKSVPGLIAGKLRLPGGGERAVGKVERARAVQHLAEARNLILPHWTVKSWVGDFISECAGFPKGAFADRVDAMTGALLDFLNTESGEFTKEMGQPTPQGFMTTTRKVMSDGEEDPRSTIDDPQPGPARSRRARW